MASAKKCDRCGQFYERLSKPVISLEVDERSNNDTFYPSIKLDLCHECEGQLRTWLHTFRADLYK